MGHNRSGEAIDITMYETGPCSRSYETQASGGGYETKPQRHVMDAMRNYEPGHVAEVMWHQPVVEAMKHRHVLKVMHIVEG